MNIGFRIKEIRSEKDISQTKFGQLIGISGASVAKLESGLNRPSERTIRAICHVFSVRRTWLEGGEGEPYVTKPEDEEVIDDILRDSDDFTRAFILGIARTPGGWEKMREVFENVQAEIEKINAAEYE